MRGPGGRAARGRAAAAIWRGASGGRLRLRLLLRLRLRVMKDARVGARIEGRGGRRESNEVVR